MSDGKLSSLNACRLRWGLAALIITCAGCVSTVPDPRARDDPPAPDEAQMEIVLFQRVNEYRHQRHLTPLTYDSVLAALARRHSRRMAARSAEVSHDGFEGRVRELRRYRRSTATAENVAMNAGYTDPAGQAFRDLLASPAHHATMVGQFTHTGVGAARAADSAYYFTQLFVNVAP